MTITIAAVTVIFLLIFILFGVHVAFSLASLSFIGVWLMSGKLSVALAILSTTSFEAIRDYMFAVLPLFVLMGAIMGNSGAAKDLFGAANYFLRRLHGGMAVATVAANAVFAAVTGVSVASAAVFSKVCLPEMERLKYDKKFALGAVAGSSVLGMLIPPSVLFILFGMLTGASIGKLFVAGIIPGIILSLVYTAGIVTMCTLKPELAGGTKAVGHNDAAAPVQGKKTQEEEKPGILIAKSLPVFLLIFLVLGGIWGGMFTPTEASAVGALGAMILALSRRTSVRQFKDVFLETAATSSIILFLLICAQMYSRMLSMSGLIVWMGNAVVTAGISPWIVFFLYLTLLLVLGCILDSASILLLTVPLIFPLATHFQWDMIWFGVVVVMVVEMGLLTPPFGMVVFAMKATLGDAVTVEDIFRGSAPFLLMMVFGVLIVIAFPVLSTWLPSLM